ncbi:MAG: L-histidine N(alpha)-methyltransferase [Actinomycetota bacterium]|nr:L-histidine N(alpha)-methyltransferase [Actinomycetota bacterium]
MSAAPEITIDRHVGGASDMGEEVREGLTREPLKELPPKLFYDARGSELFDQITAQPEYYPARAERSILNRCSPEIVELSGADELVELGSGVASKTRALLYAMAGTGTLYRYVPFDIDRSVVETCATELTEVLPGMCVHGVVGDFARDLERLPEGDHRLIAFLGGTVGNLYPDERAEFLARVRDQMGPSDHLLVGMDLVKDRGVLEAAYNDSAGVTAAFNLNVLNAVNEGLGADFDLDDFEHVAFFDPGAARIEMRLRSLCDQHVSLPGAGVEIDLAEGEEIRTEISSKFTRARIEYELEAAGLELTRLFCDDEGLFSLALAAAAAGRSSP